MKTVSIADSGRSWRRCRRFPRLPVMALAAGLTVLISGSSSALAQSAEVRTLGGGPKTLPVSLANSAGSADGKTLDVAQFNQPFGCVLDSAGNLYVADSGNGSVRKISKAGDTANSFTTTIISGLSSPVAVALDSGNNLYVLTQGDGTLRKYSTAGTLLSTITAALASPTALSMDANTNFFIIQTDGALVKVTSGGTVSTPLAAGTFAAPRGVAVIDTNSIAISDTGNNNIKLLTLSSTTTNVTLYAGGTNGAAAGYADGQAVNARFNAPYQIAKAPNGSLVVADRSNHRVRLVSTGGSVNTLYGVDPTEWFDFPSAGFLAGWVDGSTTNAAAREPVGVFVSSDGGSVFVTEDAYHLVRRVSGTSLQAPTSGGGGGVNSNTNLTANLITFGFQSGEASSDFVGGPGQFFTAPVTLTLLPNQTMFSLGFSLAVTVTNDTIPGADITNANDLGFASMLVKPDPDNPGYVVNISNQFAFAFVTNVITNVVSGSTTTNVIPVFTNAVFTNVTTTNALLNVHWVETSGKTNLYNTTAQDLITFSQAHVNLFNKSSGSVILGAFGFRIPTNAPLGSTYRIQVLNASAATNIEGGVTIQAPTDGSLSNGLINSIKVVTVGIRSHLVGDVSNFRWLNSGDFGDGTLTMDDVSQTFMSAIYRLNVPAIGSDFFDAMDSSNGKTNLTLNAATGDIDTVQYGDGQIAVDDVLVTLRRLNPYAKWYTRFWSNGILQSVETSNNLAKPTFGKTAARSSTRFYSVASSPDSPGVAFLAGDAVATGQTIAIPINVQVSGAYPLKSLMLQLAVKPLDGSPPLTQPVGFQFLQEPALGSPMQAGNAGNDAYTGLWVAHQSSSISGLSAGTHLLGNLIVTLPANAPSTAAYAVIFDHASASPFSLSTSPLGEAPLLFRQKEQTGLATASNRSASSWGDAIPDSWRLRNFGMLFNILSAANADADGDGVPNWAEFKAGTNPSDAGSRLKVLADRLSGGPNGFKLRWPTILNKTYVLEYSTSLFDPNWIVVSTNVIGNGQDVELNDSSPVQGVRFYRVRLVEDPPSN